MSRFRNLLMILAPVVTVGISIGIYYAVNKEKFKSCTCAKDRNGYTSYHYNPTSQETYPYNDNQPKTDVSGKEIKLTPVNDFTKEPKETYTTAYYKEAQNNPETHSRFSGV